GTGRGAALARGAARGRRDRRRRDLGGRRGSVAGDRARESRRPLDQQAVLSSLRDQAGLRAGVASPCPKRTSGRMRPSQLGAYHAAGPAKRNSTGMSSSRTRKASNSTAMPKITPISLGGRGPERAKVKKTATITAPAALITRPEWASPPTTALRASPSRSQLSLAEESRKTV